MEDYEIQQNQMMHDLINQIDAEAIAYEWVCAERERERERERARAVRDIE